MKIFLTILFCFKILNLISCELVADDSSFFEVQHTNFLVQSETRLEKSYNFILDHKYNKGNFSFDGYINLNASYKSALSGDIRIFSYKWKNFVLGKEKFSFSNFSVITPIANLNPGVYWDPMEPYNSGSFQLTYKIPVRKFEFIFSVLPVFIPDLNFVPEINNGRLETKNRFVANYYDSAIIRGEKHFIYLYTENEPIAQMLFTHPKFVIASQFKNDFLKALVAYSYGPENGFRGDVSEFVDFDDNDEIRFEVDAKIHLYNQHILGFTTDFEIKKFNIFTDVSYSKRLNSGITNPDLKRNDKITGAIGARLNLKEGIEGSTGFVYEKDIPTIGPSMTGKNSLSYNRLNFNLSLKDFWIRNLNLSLTTNYGLKTEDLYLGMKIHYIFSNFFIKFRSALLYSERGEGYFDGYKTADFLRLGVGFFW